MKILMNTIQTKNEKYCKNIAKILQNIDDMNIDMHSNENLQPIVT